MHHRLDLCAGRAADIVGSAGGWMVDHVLAGWRVTVCAPPEGDVRALVILGVDVRACGHAHHEKYKAVVVPGQDFHADALPGPERVCHRLSTAARAFKAQALIAAGLPNEVPSNEVFWLLQQRSVLATPAAQYAAHRLDVVIERRYTFSRPGPLSSADVKGCTDG